MTSWRIALPAVAAVWVFFVVPVEGMTVITRATVSRVPGSGVRVQVDGVTAEDDWESPNVIVVKVGGAEQSIPISAFRHRERKGIWLYRGGKGQVVQSLLFHLGRGRFALRALSPAPEDYADPLRVSIFTPGEWTFDVPVDPLRRKSRFRGALLPR